MKTATHEEWKAITKQSRKVREELFVLINLSSGKMPVALTKYIRMSINALDRFRCDAETRIYRTTNYRDTSFYGKEE